MNCPKCKTVALESSEIASIQLDRCPACHGFWFDSKELPQLLEANRNELRRIRSPRSNPAVDTIKGDCPRCGKPLLRVKGAANRNVTVDACPDCGGTWLDAGEFAALLSGD